MEGPDAGIVIQASCWPAGAADDHWSLARKNAAPFAPLISAAVVPGGRGRASGPTRAVTGSRAQRFRTSTSACTIRGLRTTTSGADVSGRHPHHPLVGVGAAGYERSLDFPARDPAAAGRYDRGAKDCEYAQPTPSVSPAPEGVFW